MLNFNRKNVGLLNVVANKQNKPSPIPHGSIVRTTWPDEEFDSFSGKDGHNNDGWTSPGVNALKTDALKLLLKKGHLNDESFFFVPHNTRSLMIVDHVWYESTSRSEYADFICVWYNVLFEDRDIWIHARNIILVKKSTI